jgi:predicted DNA binding CopG/RHH family protein
VEVKIIPVGHNFMEIENKNKRKGGRPKKGISERKTRTIHIRVSEPEYYAVKHRAELAGLTVSAYSHSAILESKIIEPVKKEDMELLRKLSGMGNNLNQLAYQANKFQLPFLEKAIRNVLILIIEIIEKLSNDWKNNKRKKL